MKSAYKFTLPRKIPEVKNRVSSSTVRLKPLRGLNTEMRIIFVDKETG